VLKEGGTALPDTIEYLCGDGRVGLLDGDGGCRPWGRFALAPRVWFPGHQVFWSRTSSRGCALGSPRCGTSVARHQTPARCERTWMAGADLQLALVLDLGH
jgi:hypothetical protein